MSIAECINDLESAEEFLEFFAVPYDPGVVHVNRLHILQRLHDYLAGRELPDDDDAQREIYRTFLDRAYNDFVSSDARTEKVFKVFRQNEVQTAFVPVASLRRRGQA